MPTSLYTIIIDFFRSLPKKNPSLLVAVSGGSDSVALVHLLHELSQQLGINRIAIAHVNHGLRGDESDQDEQLVQKLAKDLSFEFYLKRLNDLSMECSDLENVARSERYSFFHALKNEHTFDYIVTGHTVDDQAETVLARLIRGTGLSGLRSIHSVRYDGVIRPLISVTKQEILSWLNEKGIHFRVDSSNFDTRFSRNYLRHKVLPAIVEIDSSAIKKIASIADEADSMWPLIERAVQGWVATNVTNLTDFSFRIKKEGFADRALASQAIHSLFNQRGVDASRKHIATLFSTITRTSGQFLLPSGWSYYPQKSSVLFSNGSEKKQDIYYQLKNQGVTDIVEHKIRISITKTDVITVEERSDCAQLDAQKCGGQFIYRTVRADDWFYPLGRETKTNVLSFLAKQGITRIERERVGVIVNSSNKLLWILGIRIDSSCRVTETTHEVIKFTFQPLCDIV